MILTAEQMHRADARTIAEGAPGTVLMERAGRAVAKAALECAPDSGRIVIMTGPGNNGGDGYAAARFLAQRNVGVTVVALVAPESLHGDAAEHARLAIRAGVKVRIAAGPEDMECLDKWLARAVIVVDAIFGAGLARPLKGWIRDVVERINSADRPVLAVDIASGVNSDTGEIMGAAVRAAHTLPIAATKWGHWLGAGREYAGNVLPSADIGISGAVIDAAGQAEENGMRSAMVIDKEAVEAAFPVRARDAHKGRFGHVWVFGGSIGYTGAPRLAAMGAMAVHAGLTSIACPEDTYAVIASACLEVMAHPQDTAPWQSADAFVVGPGWGASHQPVLARLLATDVPLVLDADALNMIAGDGALRESAISRKGITVFTPHPGEAGRLLGCTAADVQRDRPRAALDLARLLSGWVVLKGAETLVVSPEWRVWLCPFGCSRLATAGTGDVLAGMIGGLLAQGAAAEVALPAAVGLHAIAGEQKGWFRAGQLPAVVAAVRDGFS